MKRFCVFVFLAAIPSWTFAEDAGKATSDELVAKLRQRIEVLEKRVAELEKQQNATASTKPEEQKDAKEQAKAESQSGSDGIIQLNPQTPYYYINPDEFLDKYPELKDAQPRSQDTEVNKIMKELNLDIPKGWQRRSFNGFTYYVVPLAHQPSRGASTMNAR